MAFSIVVILLFAALAIDISYMRTAQFELHNAADAAAHAALVELRRSEDTTQARQLAKDVAAMNTVGGKAVELADSQIQFGAWDYDGQSFTASGAYTNAVKVTIDRNEDAPQGAFGLLMGPVLGHKDAALSASATGAFRYRDVLISQDITTSFWNEMDDAVAADLAFIDQMYSQKFPNDRLGLRTFTGYYESSFTALQYLTKNYTAIRAKWYGDGKSNLDKTKTSGLTNCYVTTTAYKNKKNYNLPGKWMLPTACGYTNPGLGILNATTELVANNKAGNIKVIVLVSDGAPSGPWKSGVYGVQMADYAASKGVSIYTVSFNEENDAAQKKYLASLKRGYGKAYDTPDSSQLKEILEDIAKSLPVALVE
jgi:hypothetical protein